MIGHRKTYVIFFNCIILAIVISLLCCLAHIIFCEDEQSCICVYAVCGNDSTSCAYEKNAIHSDFKISKIEHSTMLTYEDKTFILNLSDFVQNSDVFIIQSKNHKWGRDGDRENAVFAIEGIVKMGFTYEQAFEFVYKGINKKINDIVKQIDIKPKDSQITFTPNFAKKFYVSQEKVGYLVDKEELYKQIFENTIKSNINLISINTHKVVPKLTKEENTKATQLLSKFSTNIAKSTSERKHNVKLALSAFNGKRIEPDEIVSFNETTGRRTEKNGYKPAHIILNEVFVDGVGGGVCQSSTTLYNALLLADNVKIKQATRHSMPVGYVQLGFDAMVSYGTSDLVFQNNSKYPMFLHTYTKNNNVYVEVYGAPNEKGYTKKRRTEIIKTLDAKPDKKILDKDGEYLDKVKYKGETHRLKWPQKGYEVQTYIDYYNGEEFVRAVPVRHTTYPAQEGIIIEGTLDKPSEEPQSWDFKGDFPSPLDP